MPAVPPDGLLPPLGVPMSHTASSICDRITKLAKSNVNLVKDRYKRPRAGSIDIKGLSRKSTEVLVAAPVATLNGSVHAMLAEAPEPLALQALTLTADSPLKLYRLPT